MSSLPETAASAPPPAAGKRAIDDCWNRIGVRGNRSCARLAQHIHCRNCPVYAAAAAELRNGELGVEQLAEWTALVARGTQIAAPRSGSALVFRLASEWLALPTLVMDQVCGPRPVHSLPHRHNGGVLGLANVRGELLVCISLHQVLGLPAARQPAQAGQGSRFERMLVARRQGSRAVFPVDEVLGVERFDPERLSGIPSTLSKGAAVYSRALLELPGKSVGLLDEALLFQTVNRSLALATAT